MKNILQGRVVKGDGYGRKLGFPTVNLEIDANEIPKKRMKEGVYAGLALLDDKEYKAGIVIGPDDKTEAHLIGYNGNAYGKKVALIINKFLREYKKFNTEEELIIQIKKDIEEINNLC